MPFINVKVNIPLTEEKRIAVKTALGKSIEAMGKSEDYLMVGFEENVPLYFAGEKEEKCAFVDVRVFGEVDPKQADDMTKLICQTLEMVLGIPASKTYVTYQGFTDWGWNGKNFLGAKMAFQVWPLTIVSGSCVCFINREKEKDR